MGSSTSRQQRQNPTTQNSALKFAESNTDEVSNQQSFNSNQTIILVIIVIIIIVALIWFLSKRR